MATSLVSTCNNNLWKLFISFCHLSLLSEFTNFLCFSAFLDSLLSLGVYFKTVPVRFLNRAHINGIDVRKSITGINFYMMSHYSFY